MRRMAMPLTLSTPLAARLAGAEKHIALFLVSNLDQF